MTLAVHDGLLQVFDVEHGACSLMTVPDGGTFRRLMIDCGDNTATGFTPGHHLTRVGTRILEQLIITNLDEDHVSGYPSFGANNIDVRWMLFNPSVDGSIITHLKSETGIGRGMQTLVQSLSTFVGVPPRAPGVPGPADALPGVALQWYWNRYPDFDDENNLSLILALTYSRFTFLFPGDMEKAGFKNMLEKNVSFRALMPQVDILVASHHGRESGLYRPMFEQYGCNPKLTVISDDAKQHETQETTEYYRSKTSGIPWGTGTRKVMTTRSDGEIRFSFQNGNCHVSCETGV